ncbi:acid phosphatase det1 [Bulinus truncatus]|nr:acid phosphatase det1 [Bulinus truncatus]
MRNTCLSSTHIKEVVTFRNGDPCNMPCQLFVVYNMNTTEILGVYEHTSAELLELMENFQDQFQQFMVTSSALSSHPHLPHRSMLVAYKTLFKWTLIVAKNVYDDKWVSQLERPKTCGDHPIRFFARNSGMLSFKINTGPPERQISPPSRRLIAFVCHPTEPFNISVQRTAADYRVNFHVRKCPV